MMIDKAYNGGEYAGYGDGLLPSAEEVEKWANAYFPEFNAQVCGEGIERLVEEGDPAVFHRAAGKAENYLGKFALGEQDYLNILDEVVRRGQDACAVQGEPGGVSAMPDVPGSYASAAQEAPRSYGSAAPDVPRGYASAAQEASRSYGSAAPDVPGSYGSAVQNAPRGYAPVVVSPQEAESRREIRVPQAGYGYAGQNGTGGEPNAPYGRIGFSKNSGVIVGTKSLEDIRRDFPILSEKVNGHPLVWLDNGATTQKPNAVIERLNWFYRHENSNVHRGAHELAARSTDAYEGARQIVADFIGAPDKDNIVFVRGTTEGINLAAHAYVKQYLSPGDEIIVTLLEHHANIVPWQLIAQETGAVLKVAPVDKSGQIILPEYEKLFTRRTKFVSATHVSNALGTITPVQELVAIAHRHGVRILIDGAQSVAHIPVNVSALDADFFVFSGHKIFGPTGIGALYGKKELLEAARPYHGGGNMIADVTFERTIYNPAPNKFEAGTASIADAVGLGAALEYLDGIGMEAVNRHEHEILQYATKEMSKIKGLHMIGTAAEKASVLSFILDGVSNEKVGEYLNQYGIAVRTGHHCAQPILRSFGLEGVVRPTLAFYNSAEDIDALVRALKTLAH